MLFMSTGSLIGLPWSALALALLLAFVIDAAFGEPPNAWHPVAWMGHYLNMAGKRFAPVAAVPGGSKWWIFSCGAGYWCAGALLVVALATAVQVFLMTWPWWAAVIGLAVVCKPLFACRMLFSEVAAVESALAQSLPSGRQRLSQLCSRNTSELSEEQVRETAIETLAENLNDSVVAPVFWFVLLGLPGVALYRFANTADAMWGYLGERAGHDWTWAGKWAARCDDVLSWLPARLTALLLAVAAGGLRPRRLRGEAVKTPSPNSGWPMAAMALSLDVRLGKPGVYCLNADSPAPQHAQTQQALSLARRATLLLLVLACLVMQFGGSPI